MAIYQIIDIDDIIDRWAKQRMGDAFTIDKIDTSKVHVEQKSVIYQSSHDWWNTATVQEEYFDNDDHVPATWHFTETVPFNSEVTWTMIKAFKSKKYFPFRITLQFPVSQDGSPPVEVHFSTETLEQVQKTGSLQSTWKLSEYITVDSYSSSRACAQIRTCKLQNVVFSTDVCISGTVKIHALKKGRKWTKQEVTASVVDALGTKEGLGFKLEENVDNASGPARHVAFRFEGLCTGEAGVEAKVDVSEIQSLV